MVLAIDWRGWWQRVRPQMVNFLYMAVTKVPLKFESCDVEESQIVLDVSYMFRAPLPP